MAHQKDEENGVLQCEGTAQGVSGKVPKNDISVSSVSDGSARYPQSRKKHEESDSPVHNKFDSENMSEEVTESGKCTSALNELDLAGQVGNLHSKSPMKSAYMSPSHEVSDFNRGSKSGNVKCPVNDKFTVSQSSTDHTHSVSNHVDGSGENMKNKRVLSLKDSDSARLIRSPLKGQTADFLRKSITADNLGFSPAKSDNELPLSQFKISPYLQSTRRQLSFGATATATHLLTSTPLNNTSSLSYALLPSYGNEPLSGDGLGSLTKRKKPSQKEKKHKKERSEDHESSTQDISGGTTNAAGVDKDFPESLKN